MNLLAPNCHRLDEGLKQLVAASIKTYEYPPGARLVDEGVVCSEAHILLSGEPPTGDLLFHHGA